MSEDKAHPTKETLRQEYEVEELSVAAIAEIHRMSVREVRQLMDDYGIPRRRAGGSKAKVIPEEEFVRLYTEERLSTREIAERYSVTPPTVVKYLRKNGVKLRPQGGVPVHERVVSKEELVEQYHGKKKSIVQLSRKYKVSTATIINIMDEYGIKRRPPGRRRKERGS